VEYLVPDFALEEIEANKKEILEKSMLSEEEFQLLIFQIQNNLSVIPAENIKHKEQAENIMDAIDPDDTIFIALALSVENAGIWSQDAHFEKQKVIKIWKTEDLVKYLGVEHQ